MHNNQKECLAKINELKFNSQGLIPVITQDFETKAILMLAWANRQALEISIKTGFATYFSRSRQQIWKKGATSGNLQEIIKFYTDCDKDSVIFLVKQTGSACHTGAKSCFFYQLTN